MTYIRELCKDLSFNRFYNWRVIPKDILSNVVEYLKVEEDKLILFYDSSILETGKTGFAICDNGLYWKDISASPGYISWDKLVDTNISWDNFYIYIDDTDSFFVYKRERDLVIKLIGSLKTSLEKRSKIEEEITESPV